MGEAERLGGADEHRGGSVGIAADDVEAVVHAVGEVDVSDPGRAEHGTVAFGSLCVSGVGAGVFRPDVGLGLDDAKRGDAAWCESTVKGGAEEAQGEGSRVGVEEGLRGVHGSGVGVEAGEKEVDAEVGPKHHHETDGAEPRG
jgi:hypothetical protein